MSYPSSVNISTWPMRYDYYLSAAKQWSQLFYWLAKRNKKKLPVLCELCPGWSPKVALGAWLSNCVDSYIAFDSSVTALQQLSNFLVAFSLPIKTHQLNILTEQLPKHDFIIMNHAIDDLLLYNWCQQQAVPSETIFANQPQLSTFWKDIAQQPMSQKNVFAQRIAQQLTLMANRDTHLIITQYPGYQEKLWDMQESIAITKATTKQVIFELTQMGWHAYPDVNIFLDQLSKPWLTKDEFHWLIKH